MNRQFQSSANPFAGAAVSNNNNNNNKPPLAPRGNGTTSSFVKEGNTNNLKLQHRQQQQETEEEILTFDNNCNSYHHHSQDHHHQQRDDDVTDDDICANNNEDAAMPVSAFNNKTKLNSSCSSSAHNHDNEFETLKNESNRKQIQAIAVAKTTPVISNNCRHPNCWFSDVATIDVRKQLGTFLNVRQFAEQVCREKRDTHSHEFFLVFSKIWCLIVERFPLLFRSHGGPVDVTMKKDNNNNNKNNNNSHQHQDPRSVKISSLTNSQMIQKTAEIQFHGFLASRKFFNKNNNEKQDHEQNFYFESWPPIVSSQLSKLNNNNDKREQEVEKVKNNEQHKKNVLTNFATGWSVNNNNNQHQQQNNDDDDDDDDEYLGTEQQHRDHELLFSSFSFQQQFNYLSHLYKLQLTSSTVGENNTNNNSICENYQRKFFRRKYFQEMQNFLNTNNSLHQHNNNGGGNLIGEKSKTSRHPTTSSSNNKNNNQHEEGVLTDPPIRIDLFLQHVFSLTGMDGEPYAYVYALFLLHLLGTIHEQKLSLRQNNNHHNTKTKTMMRAVSEDHATPVNDHQEQEEQTMNRDGCVSMFVNNNINDVNSVSSSSSSSSEASTQDLNGLDENDDDLLNNNKRNQTSSSSVSSSSSSTFSMFNLTVAQQLRLALVLVCIGHKMLGDCEYSISYFLKCIPSVMQGKIEPNVDSLHQKRTNEDNYRRGIPLEPKLSKEQNFLLHHVRALQLHRSTCLTWDLPDLVGLETEVFCHLEMMGRVPSFTSHREMIRFLCQEYECISSGDEEILVSLLKRV